MIIFGQILTIWAIVIVVRKAFYTKAIIVFGDGFGSFFECIRRRRAFWWAATEALSPWPRTSVDMDETLDFDSFNFERSVNFEMFFGVFNFFQKMNENKSTWGIIVVKSNLIVRFLEESQLEKIISNLSDLKKL